MTRIQQQIASLIGALRVVPPFQYRWFGELSQKPPRDVLARVDALTLRRHLIGQIQSRLYQQFYQHGIAIPANEQSRPRSAEDESEFVRLLSLANQGDGSWQRGWDIVSRFETGVWAVNDGPVVWVPTERLRIENKTTQWPEGAASVMMPKEFPKRSPGFYLAQGDEGVHSAPDDKLVRLYWHPSASGAAMLVESVTAHLNAENVPFQFKLLNHPAAYRRNDAAVLYIAKGDLQRASSLIPLIYSEVRGRLLAGIPALTRRLAPGLGLAEDPRNGESFGLHRCRLLAEAFVGAAMNGIESAAGLVEVVGERFRAEGLVLSRPYLNPGSIDDYGRFLQVVPDQPVPGGETKIGFKRDSTFITGDDESSGRYVDVARAMADHLVKDAIWHDGRCTWMGPRPAPMGNGNAVRQPSYGVVGPDVYSGTAGIALFLAQCYATTGDEAHRIAARGAAQQAARTAAQLARHGRIGFYTGWPGVMVACVRVGKLTGNLELATDLPRQLVAHFFGDLQTSEVDLLSGTAGAAAALLALWRLSGNEEYLENATQLGDHLLASAKHRGEATWWPVQTLSGRRALTGFAHGAAGIAFALLELFDATADQRYRRAAEGAFAFEQRNFHPGLQNWLDLRYPVEGSRFGPGAVTSSVWCHGSGGIAISRLHAWKILGERIYLDEADAALRATSNWLDPERSPSNDRWSLCHGLAGNADILLWASRSAPDRSIFLGRAHAVADKGVALARASDQATDLFATDEPGLFLGHAGIGYFYLRLANPAIPSVLVPSPSALAAFPNS